ncbi:hypothetical protein Q7F20_09270 [Curtobacterium sp. A7_M15]|uniref:hypothetical protein n=1 Tax=Curtobacterium sp. A7_M15 TaxID=3065241 RepID=UPI002737AE8F|nr:hypothetical protein [Curtobacterium sp. A7_M15]MDP4333561.1 hypothetical protein [Curtobacterium sp. A7_M15]
MSERHAVPLTDEEAAAVNKAFGKAVAFITDATIPFGFTALDLVLPRWHRVVEGDEPQPAPVQPEPVKPLVEQAQAKKKS